METLCCRETCQYEFSLHLSGVEDEKFHIQRPLILGQWYYCNLQLDWLIPSPYHNPRPKHLFE
jgi:hypothetical protein